MKLRPSKVLLIAILALFVIAAGVVGYASRSEDAEVAPVAADEAVAPAERTAEGSRRVRAAEETVAPVTALEEQVEPAAEKTEPKHMLRLVDGRGEPVSGVWVKGSRDSHFTDARGETELTIGDEPESAHFFDGEKARVIELEEPVTEVRLDGVRTLEVGVVDGATGEIVPGVRWRTWRREEWSSANSPAPALPLDRRFEADVRVVVEPPEGYGALDPFEWEGEVAARATSVRVAIPVWPARELLLRLVDTEGFPVEGAKVRWAHVHLGQTNPTDVTFAEEPSGADGLLRVGRLPRIPFAKADVHVARTESGSHWELGATVEGIVLDDPSSGTPLDLVLRRQQTSFRGSQGFSSSSCGFPSRLESPAPLAVRVLHVDGTPAARVVVSGANVSGRTDREGNVKFDEVRRGVAEFAVYAHGFVATAVRVDVGAETEIVVREPEPRRVRVLVTDASGRPLPAVFVTSECRSVPSASNKSVRVGCSVAQFDGEVELATPRTDRDGLVELREPTGTVRYRAAVGAGRGETESSDDFVRIVVCAPK